MPWSEFLAFLMGPGISVVVGIILSFVVEYWPAYEQLEAKWKRLVFFGLCMIVPVLGAILSAVSGFALWADFEGLWWPVLVAGWAAFFSGSMAHVRKLVS
jgi:hypothetical protein